MLTPGTHLGSHKIVRQLGVGGMAEVYEAIDKTLDRRVALKVLPDDYARDPERAERFRAEILRSACLEHPNLIRIYGVGRDDGRAYYTMPLLRGGDLKKQIAAGPMAPDRALHIARQVADALGTAHAAGFVHRDVKPENILFADADRVVLTDMGIARAIHEEKRLTRVGTTIGTPHYMSPEQTLGRDIDGRSDLYSLGIVLYEMLTGRVPFDGQDSHAIGFQHVTCPPPPLPEHLAGYQRLIDRMLAKRPKSRFRNCARCVSAMRRLQSTSPEQGQMPASHSSSRTRTWDGLSRILGASTPALAIIVGIVVAILVTLGALYLLDGDLRRLTGMNPVCPVSQTDDAWRVSRPLAPLTSPGLPPQFEEVLATSNADAISRDTVRVPGRSEKEDSGERTTT